MRVLITNDDGIHAPGIAALIDAAKEIGASEIYVIAPEREQSAKSHAITIREPLFITELPQRGATRRIAVRGTPSDCVRLACIKLLDPLPDLCLSGVNHGANLGWDVFFSGTVAAAAEASSFGIPSVGISLCTWQDAEWDEVPGTAAAVVRALLAAKHKRADWLFNVNLPYRPRAEIKGVRLTHQEPVVKGDNFEERLAPDGRRYFWPTWSERVPHPPLADGTLYDAAAVRAGYVSVTPIRYEVTAADASPGVTEAIEAITL